MEADRQQLLDLLRNEGEKDDGLLGRLLLCRFLATCALIVLARSEDNIERAVSIQNDHSGDIDTESRTVTTLY